MYLFIEGSQPCQPHGITEEEEEDGDGFIDVFKTYSPINRTWSHQKKKKKKRKKLKKRKKKIDR